MSVPVSAAGDDLVHSEEVSGAQHGPEIPGILEPLEDEPQLLGVISGPRLPGLSPGPGPQRAHLHADALVHLVAAQGVQLLPPGPQNRNIPRFRRPEQLCPLAPHPRPAGLEQEPGHAAAGGPQSQEARGQAEQEFPAPGGARGRRQVIQEQAAQLLSPGPLPGPRRAGGLTRTLAGKTPGRAPEGPQQRHGRCP